MCFKNLWHGILCTMNSCKLTAYYTKELKEEKRKEKKSKAKQSKHGDGGGDKHSDSNAS